MGAKLRMLSGRGLVSILEQFGFVAVSQNGSHVKMRRVSIAGAETLTIPYHNKIPKGTLKAIFNQASRYIPATDLYQHFYNS
jgi:predicted RNA binding protein YcfA (HicA-like mRNA interferase family)